MEEIPERNKELTFGYCREAEEKNRLSIPAMLKYMALLYFNLNQDKFDRDLTWRAIEINGNQVQSDGMASWIVNAFGENLVQRGINIWKFQCNVSNHDILGIKKTAMEYGLFTKSAIGKWGYPSGVGAFDEGDSRKTDYAPSEGYGIVIPSGNLTHRNNAKKTGKLMFDGGIKNNDTLEMMLDCKQWTLSFKLNNGKFKHAFDIEPQFKYRAAISMGGNAKSNYELLSFQQIY